MTTRTSIGCFLRRFVAGALIVCLLVAGFPASGIRRARAQTDMRVQASPEPAAMATRDRFLRDSIPATSFVAAPLDTTADDFVLPEEKDNRQIAKEIAVWIVAAAFVAFFIVKVFIEEDDEPADDDDNGKDVPPPR